MDSGTTKSSDPLNDISTTNAGGELITELKISTMINTRINPMRSMILLLVLLYSGDSLPSLTLFAQNQSITIYSNNTMNSTFAQIPSFFNCSITPLYTYAQTPQQLADNTPYTLQAVGFPPTTFTITSQYDIISPTISPSQCSSDCILTISNFCPKPTYFTYFDRVNIYVSTLDQVIAYDVLCDTDFSRNTFEWGLFLEIILCTILAATLAIYSRSWSLGGEGIAINIYLILAFNALLVIGGILGNFFPNFVKVALNVLATIGGVIGVYISANQILFLFKISPLKIKLFSIKAFKVRILDILSLLIGLGVVGGWWASEQNWIVNDVVAVSMIVGAVKVLKFTSLRIALICFLITISVEMAFVITIHFTIGTSYNIIFLNQFNNPFQLQAPTINPVYQQKCAWLPITAIIYPGLLMSYMRRFDSSRATHVYLITCTGLFLVGSISWMFISIVNPYIFPLGLISEPAMIGLVCLFAYRRREIRTLWDGKFYDQQFADKAESKEATEMIKVERHQSIRSSLVDALRIPKDREDSQFSNMSSRP